jgi:hypothetical protein
MYRNSHLRPLMFFRGLSPSILVRAAYLLVLLSFVTSPVHLLTDRRNPLQDVLLIASAGIFLFGLLVAIFRKPRDWRLGVYALVACVIHGALRPVF